MMSTCGSPRDSRQGASPLGLRRAKRRQLSKRQLAVLDELFSGELSEQAVLEKHKVSKNLYNRWLADEAFTDEFNRRIAWLNRQGELIIARYSSVAAAKLVQLTESDSAETARKACLDIISLPKLSAKRAEPFDPAQDKADAARAEELSPQTASRLLAALAEEKNEKSQKN